MKKTITEKQLTNIIKEAISEIIGYHGTGADFDNFDTKHVGSGAGSQCFGWGTYIAGSKKIGKDYAMMTQVKCLMLDGNVVYDGNMDEKENFKNPYRLIWDIIQMSGNGRANVREAIGYANKYLNLCDDDNVEMKQLWQEVYNILSKTKSNQWKIVYKRRLITVEIPDDNGKNYFTWHSFISPEVKNMICNAIVEEWVNQYDIGEDEMDELEIEKRNLQRKFQNRYLMGGEVYQIMIDVLGDAGIYADRYASDILNELGFVGIVYKAGTLHGGAENGDVNYVIFDPNNIKITNNDVKYSKKST